jgi:thiamine pyrophosphokinase
LLKALILVNGKLSCPAVLRKRIRQDDFKLVLGADRGALYARVLNVKLDAVIGDLDSLTDTEQSDIGEARIISYPVRKDETDLELALLYAQKQEADHIVMVGVAGGRLDMTLGNLLLIAHAGLSACRIEVWDGKQTGWIIRPPGEDITGRQGDTVSLIPIGGSALGVTTRGLDYPLLNAELPLGAVRGISNIMNGSLAHVSLSSGLLFVVHTPGKA